MTHVPKTSPLSKDDWLQMGLAQAGISKEELADTVREAFDENKRLLKSTRKEVKVVDGQPVEIEHPDNTARQKAIDSIYDIAGVRGKRNEGSGGGGPVFQINFPSYYRPEVLEGTIDVTPSEVTDHGDDDS